MRRGARTLFHGVWTYGMKDIEFQSVYELKNYFYFYFGCGNGTGLGTYCTGFKMGTQVSKKIKKWEHTVRKIGHRPVLSGFINH